MAGRVAWTAFVAREAEKRGFSWAYWEFDSGFGAYTGGRWNELHHALIP
jgi:endoglucanase